MCGCVHACVYIRTSIYILQMAEKRREAKGKGEKERYTHLNAEFQRLARRDKKALSEQCKEREEKNLRTIRKKCHIIHKGISI